MKIFSFADLIKLINTIGLDNLMDKTIQRLKFDYGRWQDFHKSKRHAVYHKLGVLELMPCADKDFYSFKYVNGHPNNINIDKLTVTAFGMLARQSDGYPILLCDMTLLTAIRTACMTALVASYGALQKSEVLGLIGSGAQAEFILLAMMRLLPIKKCIFFDKDPKAMHKFSKNIANLDVELIASNTIKDVCNKADILVTATASKCHQNLIDASWLNPGQMICGLGGDAPGKSEFSRDVLLKCRVVVEYEEQTRIEGDLQNALDHNDILYISDIIQNKCTLRNDDNEIIFYDSVGFALEDFSILMVLNEWIMENDILNDFNLLPNLKDVKNLYGCLNA